MDYWGNLAFRRVKGNAPLQAQALYLTAVTSDVNYSLAQLRGGLAMEIYIVFFIAAIVAGAINALAGGGGLITFTLLMLVLPPVTADATSAVALVAGYPTAVWRTRGELTNAVRSRWLWLLLIPSVLGGLLGVLLLSWSGNRNFVVLVPWLVLVATLLILLRPILVRGRNNNLQHLNFAPWLWLVTAVVTFVVALYGGYFGAGIGILMISILSLMGLGDIRQVVALKNLLTAAYEAWRWWCSSSKVRWTGDTVCRWH